MESNQHEKPHTGERRLVRRPVIRGAFAVAVLALSLGCLGAGRALAGPQPTSPSPAPTALNLTAPQQQKLAALEAASHSQVDQLIGQIRQLRGKLAGLYDTYGLDVKEARRLNLQLNRVQAQLLDLHLSEQQQLRGILSVDQFTHLQADIHRQDDHDSGDAPGRRDRDHDHRDHAQ